MRTVYLGLESGRTMPVRNVLVRDPGGHVKHDDTTLAVDVVPIAKATEFLLASGVPNVELDLAEVLRSMSREIHSPAR